ncbi:hypothetical protein GCM10010517_10630 [Streptosporangium fragile]|uniref:PucR C-terminal helix-turn-helix domain-containing protein n=1 Tax=Streptosporangium fragile TaxID=46186 RepID=A0ABP6IA22_9ACTN
MAELVNGGPLAGARMYGTGENPVHQVRIVDEPAVFGTVTPHTAVVLTGRAASGGWAVEMAMRRAWEQAAACVIAPSGGVSAGSEAVLAERLGVTLIFVDEDPLVTAVRVASAAARPEAARTQLVARCATRLAEAGGSVRRVLGTLNAELQGTAVAFLDPYGVRLAGRGHRGGPAEATVLAEVTVPSPDGRPLGTLSARGSARSPGWPAVVRTVLALAVAPLTASATAERLAAFQDAARQAALAERLLRDADPAAACPGAHGAGADGGLRTPGPGPAGERHGAPYAAGAGAGGGQAGVPEEDGALAGAAALGWPTAGPLTGYAIRPADPVPGGPVPGGPVPGGPVRGAPAHGEPVQGDPETVRAVVAASVGPGPIFRRGDGWVGWSALGPGALAAALAGVLPVLPVPCSAGVGAGAVGLAGVRESLLGAVAAAFVAPTGQIVRADRMGPAGLLAALPAGALRAPAEVVLGPLLAADPDGTLLRTLAAVLDEGGASRAADRLGVHRNTVTVRLDRIKAAGFDLGDPAARLALHLACHVLLD